MPAWPEAVRKCLSPLTMIRVLAASAGEKDIIVRVLTDWLGKRRPELLEEAEVVFAEAADVGDLVFAYGG